MLESLGEADLIRMQAEGWRFPTSGVRVGNGWMVLAVDPKGDFSPQLIADPDDEPSKFGTNGTNETDVVEQPELLFP